MLAWPEAAGHPPLGRESDRGPTGRAGWGDALTASLLGAESPPAGAVLVPTDEPTAVALDRARGPLTLAGHRVVGAPGQPLPRPASRPAADAATAGLAAYLDRRGVVRGAVTVHVSAPGADGGGHGQVETRWDPAVARQGIAALRELGCWGLVWCATAPSADGPVVVSLSPAPPPWLAVCPAAGVDLAWLAYADAVGLRVTSRRAVDGVLAASGDPGPLGQS